MVVLWFLFLYPKIYITIVSHNEEPGKLFDDFTQDREYYLSHREAIRNFALMLNRNSVKGYDFQSDWCFLQGCLKWEDDAVKANTNGKNIIQWLAEDMGFEIDPHAHESQYNYADVAYLIDSCGVIPPPVVGGFIYYPVEESIFDRFLSPIEGWKYNYTWTPQILWGAATYGHQGPDDRSSGIWKPKDKANFYTHDNAQHLVYVGGYQRTFWGVWDLLEKQEDGLLEEGKIYTATVFLEQNQMLEEDFVQTFEQEIQKLKPYEEEGRIEWVTLQQVVEIWRTEYDSVPNIYPEPQGIDEIKECMSEINILCKKNFIEICVLHNRITDVLFYSIDGRVVKKVKVSSIQKIIKIDIEEIPAGLYFLRINNSTTGLAGIKKIIVW